MSETASEYHIYREERGRRSRFRGRRVAVIGAGEAVTLNIGESSANFSFRLGLEIAVTGDEDINVYTKKKMGRGIIVPESNQTLSREKPDMIAPGYDIRVTVAGDPYHRLRLVYR